MLLISFTFFSETVSSFDTVTCLFLPLFLSPYANRPTSSMMKVDREFFSHNNTESKLFVFFFEIHLACTNMKFMCLHSRLTSCGALVGVLG